MEPNLKLAAQLLDLALLANPANGDALFEKELLASKHKIQPDWAFAPSATKPSASAMADGGERIALEKADAVGSGAPAKAALRQSKIGGLVVIQLGPDKFAGGVMDILATISPTSQQAHPTLPHTSGKIMVESLDEAYRAFTLRYPKTDPSEQIAITFSNQYQIKDGPSASAAFALLLLSLYSGIEIDPAFSITGDVSADWAVRRIGGVSGKVRAASKAGRKLIAIPSENEREFRDMLFLNDPDILLQSQVFTAVDLLQAAELARVDKSKATADAIARFDQLTELHKQGKLRARTPNLAVLQELKAILELAPNHLSAKCLHEYQTNTFPSKMSLGGSANRLLSIAQPFVDYINTDPSKRGDFRFADEVYDKALKDLSSCRSQIDTRTLTLHKELEDVVRTWKSFDRSVSSSSPRYATLVRKLDNVNKSIRDFDAAVKKILNDEKLLEEINE